MPFLAHSVPNLLPPLSGLSAPPPLSPSGFKFQTILQAGGPVAIWPEDRCHFLAMGGLHPGGGGGQQCYRKDRETAYR